MQELRKSIVSGGIKRNNRIFQEQKYDWKRQRWRRDNDRGKNEKMRENKDCVSTVGKRVSQRIKEQGKDAM
jgi:REP element-mobilizing transposase RayT